MPELPEVESVVRQLVPALRSRVVERVWFDDHPAHRFHDIGDLVGHRIEDVTRRGKYIVCPLRPVLAIGGRNAGSPRTEGQAAADQDSGHGQGARRGQDDGDEQDRRDEQGGDGDHRGQRRLRLVMHLGMTGSFRILAADAGGADHVRVRAWLDDGRRLDFRDPRRFGRFSVVAQKDEAEVVPTLALLGPEPLSTDFDVAAFAAGLAATTATVKAALLGQRLVAGVGNIYADEALWRARIRPTSRRVGPERAARLHTAIREVLAEAIEREGTTFRDYQMVNGQSGRNAAFLDAYGQAGMPCTRCGNPMRKTTVAQRGTTWCPTCQH